MIRSNNVSDIQECFVRMLNALSSPWSDWTVVTGWPDSELFQTESKNIVYVMAPMKSGETTAQGSLTLNTWNMDIGFWVTRSSGGPNELAVFQTSFLNLFQNPKTLHTSTFTVEIGNTTYTGTTLKEQGIYVHDISGPTDLSEQELNEFRLEFTITLTA